MTDCTTNALADPRVTPHGEGFDVALAEGNFHVGLNRHLLWSVSEVHTGDPVGWSPRPGFQTASEAVALVLDREGAARA